MHCIDAPPTCTGRVPTTRGDTCAAHTRKWTKGAMARRASKAQGLVGHRRLQGMEPPSPPLPCQPPLQASTSQVSERSLVPCLVLCHRAGHVKLAWGALDDRGVGYDVEHILNIGSGFISDPVRAQSFARANNALGRPTYYHTAHVCAKGWGPTLPDAERASGGRLPARDNGEWGGGGREACANGQAAIF